MDEKCIFCQIIQGKIPCYKIYESNLCLAFLDINPVNPGHTLIVPKEHCILIENLSEKSITELILTIKKLIPTIEKTVNSDGVNIILNNGRAAGQLIQHVHFHIIPRFKKDGLKPWSGKRISQDKIKKIAAKINDTLNNKN